MGHDHTHAHTPVVSLTAANNKAFLIGIILNVAFVIAEVVAGLIYHSVSLLTDAGHNVSDVGSLLLSLWALRLAQKKSNKTYTYGYKKTTVLAALANGLILCIAVGILGFESFTRLQHPEAVQGSAIAWVAALGIVINTVSAFLFFKNKEKDLNVKSAYLHLLADALVSLGVVAGGIIIYYTKWYWIDPVIGLIIMVVILVSTWSLVKDSFKMAVDAVPAGIDLHSIIALMKKIPHVTDVRHVHIWPLSTTENALTAQIAVDDHLPFAGKVKVVHDMKHELEHHNIHHSTIELMATE